MLNLLQRIFLHTMNLTEEVMKIVAFTLLIILGALFALDYLAADDRQIREELNAVEQNNDSLTEQNDYLDRQVAALELRSAQF